MVRVVGQACRRLSETTNVLGRRVSRGQRRATRFKKLLAMVLDAIFCRSGTRGSFSETLSNAMRCVCAVESDVS